VARRKAWESLTPKYRARLSRGGVTKTSYQRGDSLSKARGHANTPEHPREAARKPERYREYLRKRQGPGYRPVPAKTPEDEAYELNEARDNAYRNMHGRLQHYIKYKRETVLANVYGGETSQSDTVPGMSLPEALWTAQADTEELRSRAEGQYQGNPWWYH
jgi:hypothetical protein